MRIIVSLLILQFAHLNQLKGQHSNFNSQSNWSLNKRELQYGLGAKQFTGDLGGTPEIGTDYSLRDINV